MILKKIKKMNEGKFLASYNLLYESDEKISKVYEIVSRNKNIETTSDLSDSPAEAVVMIMHNERKDKILLCEEFRMSIGKKIYNFPSGLIESGETVIDCARRELWEETGLKIECVEIEFPESYSAIGLCNEKSICIIGQASGIIKRNIDVVEDISAQWYTKEDVKSILQNKRISARAQMYCYMWIKGEV